MVVQLHGKDSKLRAIPEESGMSSVQHAAQHSMIDNELAASAMEWTASADNDQDGDTTAVHQSRDEKLRQARLQREAERSRRLQALEAAHRQAEEARQRQEAARRARIEAARARDAERRRVFEERRRRLEAAESERRATLLRRLTERESRAAERQRERRGRSGMAFAFGSSTPRDICELTAAAASAETNASGRRTVSYAGRASGMSASVCVTRSRDKALTVMDSSIMSTGSCADTAAAAASVIRRKSQNSKSVAKSAVDLSSSVDSAAAAPAKQHQRPAHAARVSHAGRTAASSKQASSSELTLPMSSRMTASTIEQRQQSLSKAKPLRTSRVAAASAPSATAPDSNAMTKSMVELPAAAAASRNTLKNKMNRVNHRPAYGSSTNPPVLVKKPVLKAEVVPSSAGSSTVVRSRPKAPAPGNSVKTDGGSSKPSAPALPAPAVSVPKSQSAQELKLPEPPQSNLVKPVEESDKASPSTDAAAVEIHDSEAAAAAEAAAEAKRRFEEQRRLHRERAEADKRAEEEFRRRRAEELRRREAEAAVAEARAAEEAAAAEAARLAAKAAAAEAARREAEESQMREEEERRAAEVAAQKAREREEAERRERRRKLESIMHRVKTTPAGLTVSDEQPAVASGAVSAPAEPQMPMPAVDETPKSLMSTSMLYTGAMTASTMNGFASTPSMSASMTATGLNGPNPAVSSTISNSSSSSNLALARLVAAGKLKGTKAAEILARHTGTAVGQPATPRLPLHEQQPSRCLIDSSPTSDSRSESTTALTSQHENQQRQGCESPAAAEFQSDIIIDEEQDEDVDHPALLASNVETRLAEVRARLAAAAASKRTVGGETIYSATMAADAAASAAADSSAASGSGLRTDSGSGAKDENTESGVSSPGADAGPHSPMTSLMSPLQPAAVE